MNNRIIKFRCWDIQNKKWFHSGLRCCHINYTTEDFGTHKKFIFQQFTGLKDKNGREIFEGDITEPGYCQERAEIVFINSSFFFKDVKDSWDQFVKEHVDTYEECMTFLCPIRTEDVNIIGNVWENSDLLKNK